MTALQRARNHLTEGQCGVRSVRNRYLLVGLEHVTPEEIAGCVSCDVTEDFQVLRVVRYVKYPETHQMLKLK